jgi:predicted ATP-grasp superfamily ATP-dependent carboligase
MMSDGHTPRAGCPPIAREAVVKALILEDGASRQALSASRALADAGWTVGVGAMERRGMAASSRATSHVHIVPPPERGLEAFIEGVNEAIVQKGYEVVFGARDTEVLALSMRRDEILAIVPHPPHSRVLRAFDKVELAAAALRAGIAVPDARSATDEALAAVDGPVIVKARLHVEFGDGKRPPRLDTVVAQTPAEAVARADEIRAAGGEPLLQEFLPGELFEIGLLADREGKVVAEVHQVAERISPALAGVAVRARTLAPDAVLSERVAALVTELGWWGLAEIQLLVPADGEPRLIDFNGRFYGSIALAVGAGVNLPALWASLATGRPVETIGPAKVGVRYQWLLGDMRRCLDDEHRGRARSLFESARYARGAVQSVSRLSDPLPGVRQAWGALHRSARRSAA